VDELSHTILEGHRFAVEPIGAGEELLSWNLPFGRALRAIRPGEYLCNAGVLRRRHQVQAGFFGDLPVSQAVSERCVQSKLLQESRVSLANAFSPDRAVVTWRVGIIG
jgi:hypothetical protein